VVIGSLLSELTGASSAGFLAGDDFSFLSDFFGEGAAEGEVVWAPK
jgi:hypothetical protein